VEAFILLVKHPAFRPDESHSFIGRVQEIAREAIRVVKKAFGKRKHSQISCITTREGITLHGLHGTALTTEQFGMISSMMRLTNLTNKLLFFWIAPQYHFTHQPSLCPTSHSWFLSLPNYNKKI
jgi:hypothetical protein